MSFFLISLKLNKVSRRTFRRSPASTSVVAPWNEKERGLIHSAIKLSELKINLFFLLKPDESSPLYHFSHGPVVSPALSGYVSKGLQQYKSYLSYTVFLKKNVILTKRFQICGKTVLSNLTWGSSSMNVLLQAFGKRCRIRQGALFYKSSWKTPL